jgi:hypothetical protein|tara:strand:- start:21503 stop:21814 length:312 start_codon:yes stop_codon:yes gene_type:complete
MHKLSAKNVTRALALNSMVSALFLMVIGYFFFDGLSLMAQQGELISGNILAFAPNTIIGGVSALAVSVGAYFVWLEYGISLMSSSLKKNAWFQKPLFIFRINA